MVDSSVCLPTKLKHLKEIVFALHIPTFIECKMITSYIVDSGEEIASSLIEIQ